MARPYLVPGPFRDKINFQERLGTSNVSCRRDEGWWTLVARPYPIHGPFPDKINFQERLGTPNPSCRSDRA